jgi:hypothetical protein
LEDALSAGEGLPHADVDTLLVVVADAGHGADATAGVEGIACCGASAATEEHLEEVGEVARIAGGEADASPVAVRLGVAGEVEATGRALGVLVAIPVGSELVVFLALFGVGEDLVGLVDFLEFGFSFAVVGVEVGVVLAGQFTEGGLDLFFGGGLFYAEYVVVVFVLHATYRILWELFAYVVFVLVEVGLVHVYYKG